MTSRSPKIFGQLLFVLIALVAVSWWLGRGNPEPKPQPAPSAPPPVVVPAPAKKVLVGEVLRVNNVVNGQGYEESIFVIGDTEIARQRFVDGNVSEQTGQIPDGQIKFRDDYRQTYGLEYYRRGVREGLSQVYFKDGRLRFEIEYQNGSPVLQKEYYDNGDIRMMQNMQDARPVAIDGETGRGKVYFKGGRVRYEWQHVTTDPSSYKRAYNQKGQLTWQAFYDEAGNLIEETRPSPQEPGYAP